MRPVTDCVTSQMLRDVADGREAALTLGVLETDAPDVFGGRRGVGVLDGFRGRHDDLSFGEFGNR